MNYTLKTPIGFLKFILQDKKLASIQFVQKNSFNKNREDCKNIIDQLHHYFKNPAFKFDLPLQLNVTSFQKKVLEALQKIPAGKTKTYGELAKELKTSARAIGQACRRNPIPIVIPCHRVVSQKDLGGFAGKRRGRLMDIKKWLLEYEHV